MDVTADLPRCPCCGYWLVVPVSRRCPECGEALNADDLDAYRPSRRPTSWSAVNPLPLWRGVWPVLRHPVGAIVQADDTRRVTTRRAAAFAVLVCLGLVLVWPIVFWSAELAYSVPGWARRTSHIDDLIGPFRYIWQHEIVDRRLFLLIWRWEAWSVLRWSLFFVGCTALVRSPRKWRRLLLFAPWVAVLEVMLLPWPLLLREAAPEPYNLFGHAGAAWWWGDVHWWGSGAWWWRSMTSLAAWPFWLCRMPVAMLPVGFIFFRAVAGHRALAAAFGAALLVPVAIWFSIFWSDLWMIVHL